MAAVKPEDTEATTQEVTDRSETDRRRLKSAAEELAEQHGTWQGRTANEIAAQQAAGVAARRAEREAAGPDLAALARREWNALRDLEVVRARLEGLDSYEALSRVDSLYPWPPPQVPTTFADSADDTNRFRAGILTRAQLADLPKPEPLIEGTLDQNTTVLVGGHFGTLKSFIVQDWACSVATGRPWQGRQTEAGRVLYVAAEGAEGMHARIEAWEQAWHRKVEDLDVWPYPLPLTNLGDRRALTELCEERQYRLVVFDTLARCSVGLDENSAKDMGLVVDAADTIKRASRSTVVLVHHTGKDKVTMRGSSSLEDGVDCVYMSEGDAGFVKLQRTKRKDGPCEDVHTLRLKQVGESGVIENVHRLDRTTSSDKLKSLFVDTFADTGASKVELRSVADMPPASFHRGLSALLSSGALVNRGTEQRPFYHLSEVAK